MKTYNLCPITRNCLTRFYNGLDLRTLKCSLFCFSEDERCFINIFEILICAVIPIFRYIHPKPVIFKFSANGYFEENMQNSL